MGDPRHDKVRNVDKELLRRRQPQSVEHSPDQRAIKESFRRDEEEEDAIIAAQPKKVSPSTPTATSTTDPPPGENDREHKKSLSHVFISKQDFNDPQPEASWFHTIQEGINYIVGTITPLLPNPDRDRVSLIVLGGDYEEDLLMPLGNYDIKGVDNPVIYGNHRVIVGTTNKLLIRDLEMLGKPYSEDDPPGFRDQTLKIEAINDFPATTFSDIVVDRCRIHGPYTAIDTLSKIEIYRSKLLVDFLDEDYTNFFFPALKVHQHDYWTIVSESEIRGVYDRRTTADDQGRPNKGQAIYALGAYSDWSGSGVLIKNSLVRGWSNSEVWNLEFDHCKVFGGRKHPTAGDVLSFVEGDSDTGVHGRIAFDHCHLASRYIAEEGDMSTPMVQVDGITDIQIEHTKHKSWGDLGDSTGLAAGSTVVSQVVFTDMSNNPTYSGLQTLVEHSSTWREFWNATVGPVEGADVYTSDNNLNRDRFKEYFDPIQ